MWDHKFMSLAPVNDDGTLVEFATVDRNQLMITGLGVTSVGMAHAATLPDVERDTPVSERAKCFKCVCGKWWRAGTLRCS